MQMITAPSPGIGYANIVMDLVQTQTHVHAGTQVHTGALQTRPNACAAEIASMVQVRVSTGRGC